MAADFYSSRGLEANAQAFAAEAREGYTRWQAFAKVEELEKRYPRLPARQTAAFEGQTLDLATVIRASQTISQEIRLKDLLTSLMKIIIENAGAQTGVLILKKDDQWQVQLNVDSIPKLRINGHYASMIKRGSNSKDNNYLRDNLQEARWFLKSLQSRHDTLLKVANCIVERQQGFFEHGDEAMKPMVLRSIADSIEMHESTISRVTTRKYMRTPRGIYEFKYFFSSHVSTESGGECSATAIRAIIKKLVAAENPAKPLSDNKMASVLAEQGINVARRTIAKYRESLSISPSNERKRLA